VKCSVKAPQWKISLQEPQDIVKSK